MIFTETEYTKHYYVENQRLVTKIGGGFGIIAYDVFTHVDGICTSPYFSELCNTLVEEGIASYHSCLSSEVNININIEKEITSLKLYRIVEQKDEVAKYNFFGYTYYNSDISV